MRILLSLNSFKGCLEARQAAGHVQQGILTAFPAAKTSIVPLSDGGEGTLDLFLHRIQGIRKEFVTADPLGRRCSASIGIFPGKGYALIESARCCGPGLLQKMEQNPWFTTSSGLGILIRKAIESEVSRIVITLGGSATNDGGLGMAEMLGHQGLDRLNRPVPYGGMGLRALHRLSPAREPLPLQNKKCIICADVDNPLTGPRGATHTFGRQKGAGNNMLKELEEGMLKLDDLFRQHYPHYEPGQEGGGAAGGLGAALQACTRGELTNGFRWIAAETGLWKELEAADLLITGEGSMDRQSLDGKATIQMAREAVRRGIPVLAVNGRTDPGLEPEWGKIFTALFNLDQTAGQGTDPMLHAGKLLQDIGKKIGIRLKNGLPQPWERWDY